MHKVFRHNIAALTRPRTPVVLWPRIRASDLVFSLLVIDAALGVVDAERLGPMNRIGVTLGGALLSFVWFRRGRIASAMSESRRYDRMNSLTSRIAAGVQKIWLTIALSTVLLIALLEAARKRRNGKDTTTATPVRTDNARGKDDILAGFSHIEGSKDVNDPDRHENPQYEAGARGEKSGRKDETQDQYKDRTAGMLVQEVPPSERWEIGNEEEDLEVSASAKSMKTVSVSADEQADEAGSDTDESPTPRIGEDAVPPGHQSQRPEKDEGKSSDGD